MRFRQDILEPFLRRYLHGEEGVVIAPVTVFETGANRWREFDAWPYLLLSNISMIFLTLFLISNSSSMIFLAFFLNLLTNVGLFFKSIIFSAICFGFSGSIKNPL